MSCKARQYSDQMICGECGLSWDTNDPEPPECPVEKFSDDPRQMKLELPDAED